MDQTLKAALASGASVKVPPLAKALNLSANALYIAIRRGDVRATRIGQSVRIPNAEARRLLGLDGGAVWGGAIRPNSTLKRRSPMAHGANHEQGGAAVNEPCE